jgi:hypothetical protein
MAELDRLKETFSEFVYGDAEKSVTDLDRLKETLSECLRGDAKDGG